MHTLRLALLEVPANRLQAALTARQATLQEARDAMTASGAEGLYVSRPADYDGTAAYGIIIRADIEKSYRFGA